MLEDKTANNVIKRYHRIITGDQNQIEVGGNPNKVVIVVGSLAYPWGEVDVDELESAIVANEATATLSFSDDGATYSGDLIHPSSGTLSLSLFYAGGGTLAACRGLAIDYDKDNSWGIKEHLYMLTGGSLVDVSSLAESWPSTLTVIYHPLPEE